MTITGSSEPHRPRLLSRSSSECLLIISSLHGPGDNVTSSGCYEVILCVVCCLSGAWDRTVGNSSKHLFMSLQISCLCPMCPKPGPKGCSGASVPARPCFPRRWREDGGLGMEDGEQPHFDLSQIWVSHLGEKKLIKQVTNPKLMLQRFCETQKGAQIQKPEN